MTVVVPFTNVSAYADSEFELTARKRPKPRKETLDTLAQARHHLRRNLPPIPANRTGHGQDGSDYGWADLEQVDAIIWPFLDAYGLSWETAPDTSPVTGKPCLRWTIRHLESDQVESGTMPIRDGHPQDQGAAFTYAQRYALVIVSGAVVEKGDDDCARPAAKATPAKAEHARPARPRVTQERIDEWMSSILNVRTVRGAQHALSSLRSQRIDTERCDLSHDTRVELDLPLNGLVTLSDLVQAVESSLRDHQDGRRGLAPVDDLPDEPDDDEAAPEPDEDDAPPSIPAARTPESEPDPFELISAGIADHPDHDPDTSPTPSG